MKKTYQFKPANSALKLVTFDIFDTLLTRRVCTPESVFYFVAKSALEEKLISCSSEVYEKLRREAESLSRIGEPDGEIDDTRLFSFLIKLLGVSQAVAERLRSLEIEWEKKLIVPIPGAHDLVLRYRKTGSQIAFVTEMYWSKEILIEFLKDNGFWEEGDQLWASSEYGASKRSSLLFNFVFEGNNIKDKASVHHFGNNEGADGAGARKAGIYATVLPQGNATFNELLLEKYRDSSGGVSSLLAGTGRLLRLKHFNHQKQNATIARIVGNVVGPSLVLYVLWVLRAAKAAGVQRLCFVSRDGYVPYKIAAKIINAIAPEIRISYIYGSRQAWHIAGLFEFNETTFEWLLGYCDGATAETVIKRAGLSWTEVIEFAPELKDKIKEPGSAIQQEGFDAIKSSLLNNKGLQERILEIATNRRNNLLAYCEQEELNNGDVIGMVEIGWSGRTRASFERAIGSSTAKRLQWFYLGLNTKAKIYEQERIHAFLYGPTLPYSEIEALPVIAESFCFAPHGSVLGFHEKEGKVVPYFKEGIEFELDRWGRDFYFSLIEEYCNILPMGLIKNIAGVDLRSAAYKLLKEFSEKPDKEDADVWGSIPFEHDQAGKTAFTLAPKATFNFQAVKHALTFGSFSKAATNGLVGAWGAGAWSSRNYRGTSLALFVFIGHMRVNWRREINRVFSETRIFVKRIIKWND